MPTLTHGTLAQIVIAQPPNDCFIGVFCSSKLHLTNQKVNLTCRTVTRTPTIALVLGAKPEPLHHDSQTFSHHVTSHRCAASLYGLAALPIRETCVQMGRQGCRCRTIEFKSHQNPRQGRPAPGRPPRITDWSIATRSERIWPAPQRLRRTHAASLADDRTQASTNSTPRKPS